MLEKRLTPVADAHCDFLYGMYQYGYDINSLTREQTIHLPYLRQGGVRLQFFAAWIDQTLKTPFFQQCTGMIDAYYRMLDANRAHMEPLHEGYAPDGDKIATVLTVEGGEAIEGSLSALRTLKRLGVAAMTLTWNHNTELAGAAMRKSGKGLTPLGREVVREMGRINMAVDVSHLSDAGIDDVLDCAVLPVFASHSNARALCNSPRGLQDAHIRAISQQGGVVGINFFYKQLTGREDATIADIVRHIVHVAEVGGAHCCCIGSDFDGMTRYPADMQDGRGYPLLLQALRQAGFTQQEVERIAFWNLYDYIMQFV